MRCVKQKQVITTESINLLTNLSLAKKIYIHLILQSSIALRTNGHHAVEMFMYGANTLLLPNYQGLHGSNSMRFEVRRSHVLYDQTIELRRQYESAIDQVLFVTGTRREVAKETNYIVSIAFKLLFYRMGTDATGRLKHKTYHLA